MRWMCAKSLIELLHFGQNFSHLHNSIHTEVRARAMRRFANGFHLKPDKAPMGEDQLKLRELSNDGGIRMETLREVYCADAGIFLIDHAAEDHIAAQVLFFCSCNCQHTGRQATFHIVRTAS